MQRLEITLSCNLSIENLNGRQGFDIKMEKQVQINPGLLNKTLFIVL